MLTLHTSYILMQVVSLVTTWLRSSPSLASPSLHGTPSPPVTGTSPLAPLLAWPVLAPLQGREEGELALLHHTLVEGLLGEGEARVPGQYLVHLANSVLDRVREGGLKEEQVRLAAHFSYSSCRCAWPWTDWARSWAPPGEG